MVGTTTLHGGCVRYFVYMRATVCSNPTRPYQSAPSSRRAFVVVARGISTHYTDSVDLDGMATLPPPPLCRSFCGRRFLVLAFGAEG